MKKIALGLLMFTVACASTSDEVKMETAEDLYNQAVEIVRTDIDGTISYKCTSEGIERED